MFVFLTVALILIVDQKSAALFSIVQRSFLALGFGATLWRFLIHEQRALNPIINLDLFKIRMFSYSAISLLAYSLADGVVGFVLPFYLQDVLHLSASFIGIIFLVPAFLTISLAYIAGHIADKIGPRTPASIGLIACTVAYLIGASMKTDTPWILPTIMLGLAGIGTAFFTSPKQAAILSSAPREHRGFATGVLNTTYSLGNLLGISLGGVILTKAYQHYSGIAAATPNAGNSIAFVSAININFLFAAGFTLMALFTSLNKDTARIHAVTEVRN
jgi:MFS family permease